MTKLLGESAGNGPVQRGLSQVYVADGLEHFFGQRVLDYVSRRPGLNGREGLVVLDGSGIGLLAGLLLGAHP